MITNYSNNEQLDNIKVYLNSECKKINKDSVEIFIDNKIKIIESDNTILAVGFKSNNINIEQFYGITPNTTIIGDLRRVGTIRDCEEEGYFAIADI